MNDFICCLCLCHFVLLHLLDSAFPDNNAADSMVFQRFLNEFISADIVIKLLLPKINAAFRHISVLASAVPMPVTAMNEDGDLIFRKIDNVVDHFTQPHYSVLALMTVFYTYSLSQKQAPAKPFRAQLVFFSGYYFAMRSCI